MHLLIDGADQDVRCGNDDAMDYFRNMNQSLANAGKVI